MSEPTKFFGSLPDLAAQLYSDVIDLQARVQTLEYKEQLETPCARIKALESENADLQRRVNQLEGNRRARTAKRAAPNRRAR